MSEYQYRVIRADDEDELNEKISLAVSEGYEMLGPAHVDIPIWLATMVQRDFAREDMVQDLMRETIDCLLSYKRGK